MSITKEQFPSLHRFSLEQYYELGQIGLLDRRTELLDGVIIDIQHPGAADISLVVQISDSSLSFDLGEKLARTRSGRACGASYGRFVIRPIRVHCRFASVVPMG